jgi:hypothetical protein
MPKATQQNADKELAAALSRPDATELQQQILEIVTKESEPTTAEIILTKLKERHQFNVYMSDIAGAIWRMASNGSLVVESGKIQTTLQSDDRGVNQHSNPKIAQPSRMEMAGRTPESRVPA